MDKLLGIQPFRPTDKHYSNSNSINNSGFIGVCIAVACRTSRQEISKDEVVGNSQEMGYSTECKVYAEQDWRYSASNKHQLILEQTSIWQ